MSWPQGYRAGLEHHSPDTLLTSPERATGLQRFLVSYGQPNTQQGQWGSHLSLFFPAVNTQGPETQDPGTLGRSEYRRLACRHRGLSPRATALSPAAAAHQEGKGQGYRSSPVPTDRLEAKASWMDALRVTASLPDRADLDPHLKLPSSLPPRHSLD